jgi:outer membrane immunogenic protein
MIMKGLVLGAIGALSGALLASTAKGADLGRPPPYPQPQPVMTASPWDGIYVGANVGYAWSGGNFTTTDQFGVGNGSQTASGFTGGGQVGAGKTFGLWYLGVEIDYQGSSLSADGSTNFVNSSVPGVTTDVDSFGTARARVGYRWLS